MDTLLLGVGAAGNKAVIEAVEREIIAVEDTLLINSTDVDLPEKYKNNATIIGNSIGGCGKEPSSGEALMLEAIKGGKIKIKENLDPRHTSVTIVSSLEGGTGCGGTPVLAKYVANIIKMPVHIISFAGFKEDARGIKNTLTFLSKMQENYDIQIIENSKFLSRTDDNNYIQAEKLANEEFCIKLSIMLGRCIIDSSQNMDGMDLYKVVNTYGYKIINYMELSEKLKTKEQFNDIIKTMMNESTALDIEEATQQRLGVIINLPEDEVQNVDFSMAVIKKKYGEPIESFKHIQNTDRLPRFIATVSSGFKMPIGILRKLDAEYMEKSSAVSKDEDMFFQEAKSLASLNADIIFDMAASVAQPSTAKKESKEDAKALEDFYKSFG